MFATFIQCFFVEKYGFDTFFAYCDMSRQLIRWLSNLIRWLSSIAQFDGTRINGSSKLAQHHPRLWLRSSILVRQFSRLSQIWRWNERQHPHQMPMLGHADGISCWIALPPHRCRRIRLWKAASHWYQTKRAKTSFAATSLEYRRCPTIDMISISTMTFALASTPNDITISKNSNSTIRGYLKNIADSMTRIFFIELFEH